MRLFLEVGAEEIPPGEVRGMAEGLAQGIVSGLREAGLLEGSPQPEVFSTPRRLAVRLDQVLAAGQEESEWKRGPALDRSKDPSGAWSKAAEGFARSLGLSPEDLEPRKTLEGSYLWGLSKKPGQKIGETLQELLPKVVAALPTGRTMRWREGHLRFVRPIRWLVALLDDEVMDLTLAGLAATRETRAGRRESALILKSAAAYETSLRERGIEADRDRRREKIREGLRASLLPGEEMALSEDLLDEITDLVESPRVIRGTFDPGFLEVPHAVLEETMTSQQRYVPVHQGGKLAPAFLVVANGGQDDIVRAGNEKVLGARFADAAFFYGQDRTQSLSDHAQKLSAITFLKDLGTLQDRSARLGRLVPAMAELAGLKGLGDVGSRAGELALADQATSVGTEWPELEGTLGEIYARASGEDERVARAIGEGVLPRGAGGALPQSDLGWGLAVALRLDHLAGGFLAGLEPTGGADPSFMRRAAIGLLRLLEARPISWNRLLEASLALYERPGAGEAREKISAFIRGRLEAALVDEGHRPEAVQAVLSSGLDAVGPIRRRLMALEAVMGEEAFLSLLTVYKRASKLAEAGGGDPVGPAEETLDQAIREAGAAIGSALGREDDEGALRAAAQLQAPLAQFFDAVMVMDSDMDVRARRKGLLFRVLEITRSLLDFEALPAPGEKS